MTNNNIAADLVSLYNQHVINNTKETTLNKAPHDLLILNTESSKMYRDAIDAFRKEADEWDGEEGFYDADYGFASGFWAAARILTGHVAEYDL